ncbi:hypothetical protein [Paraburkholderia sp. BL6665CI2N2]|uniref:hypothetical protein n=1 Tax=Paraburkholderia sp. BL6665CI2N2 TaxID=1938806 RepID=UPI0014170D3A|nr:hypothetical protein [Paraburkholderia sp. BL6665CI2N2]
MLFVVLRKSSERRRAMHNQPDTLYGEHALDTFEFEVGGALKLASEMERAHAVARGIEATIRLVRASTVRRDIEHSSFLEPEDEDALLALAGHAAGMLAERAEHLSDWASSAAQPEQCAGELADG